MGTNGNIYGSECLLMRFLGYDPDALNRAIQQAVPAGTIIDWLGTEFETGPSAIDREPPRFLDHEFEGIRFRPGPVPPRPKRLSGVCRGVMPRRIGVLGRVRASGPAVSGACRPGVSGRSSGPAHAAPCGFGPRMGRFRGPANTAHRIRPPNRPVTKTGA
jgi:hypothetical protein